VSQSIYSNLFEPASLPSDFTKKYAPIISLMPNIDKIYRIDNANKQLIPINFGVVENSLSKTVQRKVKSIYTILQSFTPDERSIVVAEAQKITNQLDKWKITYAIPETVCPKCGQKIERQESNPLNILFTRAQLPIVAAYIQE
jgi:phosphomevalonate kinase